MVKKKEYPMKFIICLLIVFMSFSIPANDRVNPFTSYNRQVEFLEKQLANATKDQKAGIQKRLEDVRKQKAKVLAKHKEPYLRRIKDAEKYLDMAKSDSKKKSLQRRIRQAQAEINRLDAYAGGASKYDVDKGNINNLKKRQEADAKKKRNQTKKESSPTVVD